MSPLCPEQMFGSELCTKACPGLGLTGPRYPFYGEHFKHKPISIIQGEKKYVLRIFLHFYLFFISKYQNEFKSNFMTN
jgi:hypothetical protein